MYHNSRPTRTQLLAALKQASFQQNELCSQYLIATLVAHYREHQVSLADAANCCRMTTDDFLRAGTVVDNEARRMLKNSEKLNAETNEQQS